ncbi:baseplate multidomain protein megatron [Ollibium composti]|uniref:Host specificity protein n=1 Tax=Ollibium composti TaxID=2675109 RepID=A0ABY2Q5J8_9HYPH|nr:glycoside hydrolase/phage tail family protein [Mesorhizobium composti]THF56675.1 host specificity protein [Mesorhizobium composti]
MATILLQAAGAYLGGLLGPVGTAIGTAAGALAGYAVDRALINGTNRIEGPRLSGARPFTAEEGVALPRLYGTARLGGILIWATRFEESKATRRQGKLGPKVTEYSYHANVAFALCEGQIAGIRRIWADGREIDRETVELRVYQGTAEQPADPLIEAKQGAGNTPAYRDVAYVVLDRLPIGDYGNRVPQMQFEIIRPVGELHRSVRAVALLPGAIEYGLSPALVSRQHRPGEEDAVNRNVLFAGTDIAASLDELQATCPNLEHVALIVTWFGDDLRAGHCRIRPAVTTASGSGLSSDWVVSGVQRADAPVVSRHDGGAAYGGTPSDRSVIDAIAEIKARGLGVTLYPFLMMDIPDGNGLPDPYGRPAQPSYPWRGRITAEPAPLLPGSADRTAAARAQVDAFCGAALPGQFFVSGDTVMFAGSASDWGYRRLILHYAHLAARAGGVDAFLIGSELRGLTTLRDQADAFPFVEQLCALAADARTVLGAGTRITYGADWSEYFGHHPADGSGDVFFHLDALWAHPAIDAVGIDNYMPLSDWRDADYAGGNPDGFASPYDPAGLAGAIAGGEGFDWYYPDVAARDARARVPITDGAYGKPWTYRYKDIVGWWSNRHFDRVGGIEKASPTAWVPQAKPIWMTELGCPAVDKGPNQPNVFPDPKSAENGMPYFSGGGRSDAAQHRFLEAHARHWDVAAVGFDDAANPLSSVYGGRMVDFSRIYLWAWDARPFPAFPLRGDLWSDGANWNRGHWLNGRIANPALGDLVNAILADHGQPTADTGAVTGSVAGYVVDDPTSARAALEPLLDLFGLVVAQGADRLVLRQTGASGTAALAVSEFVAVSDGPVIETKREPEHNLPAEAILTFRDPLGEYQAASVRSVRLGAPGSRQHALSFPGVLEAGQARALLDDWLKRTWYGRETTSFSLPQPQVDVAPGTIVTVAASGNPSEFIVTEVEDGLVRKVSARQITRGAPAVWSGALPSVSVSAPAIVGQPHVLFLDLPAAVGSGAPQDQFRVAAWQKPWRSQAIFVAPEETGFTARALVTKRASLGRLTAALGSGFAGRIDRAGSLFVELFDTGIASISRLQLLNGANAASIRSATGAWEILQFEAAEEVAPQVWKLSGLLRGQLGTTDAMAAGAPAGADFVVLDDAVTPAGLLAGEVGLSLNWRAGPSSLDFSTDNFVQTAQVGGVRALLPYAPVHLRAKRNDGDVMLSWIRCGRIDADQWEGSEVPLGEESEQYRVEIAPVGGPVIRMVDVAESRWIYDAAAIASDFGGLPAAIDLTVRQLGTSIGWGLPASRRLALV